MCCLGRSWGRDVDTKWLKPPLLLAAANIMDTLLPLGKRAMGSFFFWASLHKTVESRQLKWKGIADARYRWISQVPLMSVCHGVTEISFYQTGDVCVWRVPCFLKILHIYLRGRHPICGSFEVSKHVCEWRDWMAGWLTRCTLELTTFCREKGDRMVRIFRS